MKPTPRWKLQSLLDRINGKEPDYRNLPTSYDDLVEREKEMAKPFSPKDPAPMSADDWAKFKIEWMESYGGEAVNPVTGMTGTEFKKHIILAGYREGTEFENEEYLWAWERLRRQGIPTQHHKRWFDSDFD